jgi:hypothetical protein
MPILVNDICRRGNLKLALSRLNCSKVQSPDKRFSVNVPSDCHSVGCDLAPFCRQC